MMTTARTTEAKTEIPYSHALDDVTFSVTQLSKHNNSKSGHWVAINGLVYDITKSIESFKELQPYTGTDISDLFPGIEERLSKNLIGRLAAPTNIKQLHLASYLFTITKVVNELDNLLSEKRSKDYNKSYAAAKLAITDLLSSLSNSPSMFSESSLLQITQAKASFKSLTTAFESLKILTPDEYEEILLRFKGLANLIKYTLEEAISKGLNEQILHDDLSLLENTVHKDQLSLARPKNPIDKKHHITILGGSIVGVILAMQFKKLGLDAFVYDKLDDPRVKYSDHQAASINILLTERGLRALDLIGLRQKVIDISFPLVAKSYHLSEMDVRQEFFGPTQQALYCVRRDDLLCLLITEAEKLGVNLNFGVEISSIKSNVDSSDLDGFSRYDHRHIQIHTSLLFGADGCHSSLRQLIEKAVTPENKTVEEEHKMTYREFILPANGKGAFRLDNARFHVWPRSGFNFIALPNEDKSFTLLLFMDRTHAELPRLQADPEYVAAFIKRHLPELSDCIENIVLNEPKRRWGILYRVNAKSWHYQRTMLIGDAAHAFYPFNGQSGNCGIEDSLVLVNLIRQQQDKSKISFHSDDFDWNSIFKEFQKRKVDTDTIAYYEKKPPAKLPTPEEFKLTNRVELELFRQRKPSFLAMAAFTGLPYSRALDMSADQESLATEVTQRLQAKGKTPTDDDIRVETTAAITRRQAAVIPRVSLSRLILLPKPLADKKAAEKIPDKGWILRSSL